MYFLVAKIRELLDMVVQKLLSLLSAACFSFYSLLSDCDPYCICLK